MNKGRSLILLACLFGCHELAAANADLGQQIERLARTDGPSWVHYRVPIVETAARACCLERRCRLGDDDRAFYTDTDAANAEASDLLDIFVRARRGKVDRIESYSSDCTVELAGHSVERLDGVTAPDSVSWLAGLVGESDRLRDAALNAIALHADDSARRRLIALSAPPTPRDVRKQAVFWLGAARGAAAFDPLEKILRADPSREVRKHAVFAISLIEGEPRATELLFELAREHDDAEIRSTAIFWLAQHAGERVEEALREVIAEDPELEVKEKAIFALSQLPPERSVSLLLDVASDAKRHPELRRTAMFWLAQSEDPRALALFEEILLDRP